jgi:trigger factor
VTSGQASTAADALTVRVEPKPGSRVELQVEAPAAEVDAAVEAALRRLAGRVRLPGFRPGKAPGAVVERALGWAAVRQEAIDQLLPRLYALALEQAGVDPVGDPEVGSVGDLERSRPLSFTATVTVRPEVELGDYLGLRVAPEHPEVTEEQVDEVIDEVRRRHSELVDVDRPAQAGDVLRATLVMRRGDEVVGGEGEERDVELDRDRLLGGLADALTGLAPGAATSAEITLPDDYPREELRGVPVTVDIRVAAVRERKLPPLDDSLAALDGHGSNLSELRDHYRKALEEHATHEEQTRFENAVLEQLRDQAVVDIPEVMVDAEIDRELREMELQLSQAGLRLDSYLQYSGQTLEQVRGERRETAVRRVKLQLALEALAAAEGLEVDEADVEREERRLAGDRKLSAEQRQRLHRATHRDLLLRGAVERALEIARGEV